MLYYLQSVSFEINLGCPLAAVHTACPICVKTRFNGSDTSRPLTDDIILASIDTLYNKLRFRGWVNWHYFNDPAVAFDRISAMIPAIRKTAPNARVGLFTNGIALPKDVSRCVVFDRIWLKDYTHDRDWSVLRKLMPVAYDPTPRLDARLTLPRDPQPGQRRCNRLYDELPIDHYGYGHICTDDWNRVVDIGNIWDIGIEGVAAKHVAVRDKIRTSPMADMAPDWCKTCGMPDKFQNCVIDNDIYREAQGEGLVP